MSFQQARRHAARVFLFASILFTAGCATQARKPLPEGTLPVAGTLPVEVYVGQQELLIESQSTNPMAAGGGLLGALIVTAIDNSAAKKDEARMSAIRDLLVGEDVTGYVVEQVRTGLDPARFGRTLDLELVPETVEARLARQAMPSRDGVLMISAKYALTYDMRALRVSFDTAFGDRVVKGKRITRKSVFSSRVEYLVPLPGDSAKDKEDARAAKWAAQGREYLIAQIRAGFATAIAMLNHDIAADVAANRSTQKVKYAYGALATGSGRVERESDGRRWVRVTPALLVSVP